MVNTTNAHYRSLIHYDPPPRPFIIKVNSGLGYPNPDSFPSQFTIPTSGGGYNYDLKTSDGQSFTGLTGNKTIIFPANNIDYILEISGDFPHWHQGANHERTKVRDIIQWGDIKWSSFQYSFMACGNLILSATDKPDLSNVTNMQAMFANTSFNKDISDWDVSNVTNMQDMFRNSQFNSDISGWDVNNVTNWNDFRTGSPLSNANTPPKFL